MLRMATVGARLTQARVLWETEQAYYKQRVINLIMVRDLQNMGIFPSKGVNVMREISGAKSSFPLSLPWRPDMMNGHKTNWKFL